MPRKSTGHGRTRAGDDVLAVKALLYRDDITPESSQQRAVPGTHRGHDRPRVYQSAVCCTAMDEATAANLPVIAELLLLLLLPDGRAGGRGGSGAARPGPGVGRRARPARGW